MTCRSCSREAEQRRRERNKGREITLPPQSEAPICITHNIPKTATKSSGRSSGFRWNCRACGLETATRWIENNRDKRTAQSREFAWKRIGIKDFTYSDYEKLLEEQEYRCAICSKTGATHVDHDHETGKVRAVLCGGCNKGLGHFVDSPDLLRKAAKYLEDKSS